MAPLEWWREEGTLQKLLEDWGSKLRAAEDEEIEYFLKRQEKLKEESSHDGHDGNGGHGDNHEVTGKMDPQIGKEKTETNEETAAREGKDGQLQSEQAQQVQKDSHKLDANEAESKDEEQETRREVMEEKNSEQVEKKEGKEAEKPQPGADGASTPVPPPVEEAKQQSKPEALSETEEASASTPSGISAAPIVQSATSEEQLKTTTAAEPAEGDKAKPDEKPPEKEKEGEHKPPLDPEAVRAAAQKAADVLSQLLQKPLEYEVQEALPTYSEPDPSSKEIRTLARGQRLFGYPGGGWLRLQPQAGMSGWAHIGCSLALTCLLPTIRARYLEAIDVAWPGFGGLLKPGVKVVYIVEWRCRKSGASGHAVCHKAHEVVSNMPPGKPLELHVAVRLRAPLTPGVDAAAEVRFAGPWVEAQTLNPMEGEDDEDAEASLDPFGTARAGCLDCACYGFFWRPGLEEKAESDQEPDRVGLNADPDTIKCIRCGDPFATHTRAGTPAAEKLLDSRQARKFLVAHTRVFVRSKRSVSGDAIGAVRQGTEISGCCEGRWLHLTRECAQAVNVMPKASMNSHSRYVDAWVLMDGSRMGIASDLLVPEELAPAELRERAQQEAEERQKKREAAKRTQEKKAVAKAKGKEVKETVPDSEDEPDAVRLREPLQGLMEVLYTKPVDYLILKSQLPIHRRPSTSSRTLGHLKRGQIISGWPQESWLLLAENASSPKAATAGWILIDATPLGLGLQAQAQFPVPKEVRPFSEAVVLEWSKFPARHVEYQVEWADESEKDQINVAVQRETMTMVRVHELPSDSQLTFRLTAKVYTGPPDQGGEVFAEAAGPWEEAETGATIEKLEEGNLCVDPLANLRGRCMDCSCHGFVLAEYGERPRTGDTLEEVSCRRCSCSCVRHFIIGEYHYRNPASANIKRPPVEAPKALPPPKEEVRPSTWRVEDGEGNIQFVLDKVGEAQTLYETLGVSGDADRAVIRSAYRQVSLSIHPDKVGHFDDFDLQKQAENAFKVVSSAYEILNDDKRRAEYDRKLRLTGATFTSRSGGRFNLTNIAFLKKFLSKEKGGFGWDLSAKPPGDWEEQAPGVYVRGSGKPKESEEPTQAS
ncbi:DnaJ homolog subfamily C member 1 (DnaJ protein homolog MTJ1) [Durusdinium trenchii]|uniref:DnaJ homolog subfamily C member 1 (DnaJ protein homolog MTJ1) n=1 Tax=Durusdinium trenchii TaxID=1381693 RepID=A0ABP0JT97_9DINO